MSINAYVINMPERADRWEQMLKVWEGSCLTLHRIPAQTINHIYTDVKIACFVSHQRIIRMAKDAELPYVLILEDDATKEGLEWDARFQRTLKYLEGHSNEWEIFLGGGMRTTLLKPWCPEEGLFYSACYMTHFMIVNQSVYDRFLAYNPIKECLKGTPIDYITFKHFIQVSVYPVLSEQDPLMIFNEREQALYLEHFRETNYVAQLLLHHTEKEPSPEVASFFDGLSSGTILCFTFDLARSHPGTFFIET
ncbi:MAG: glycosyltransferase family 25 protein [Nitrososphaerales archaeon]